MAGMLKDAQPPCNTAKQANKNGHHLWQRNPSAEAARLATVFLRAKFLHANRLRTISLANSIREFHLGATIPFRLGNIPGCLWFEVTSIGQAM